MAEGLINVNGDSVQTLEILFLTTVITLLPSMLVMMTSFSRIIISLSFLRTALGTQQNPPNMVLIGIALFLTLFIMNPVLTQIQQEAYEPYTRQEITQEEALDRAQVPLKNFMLRNTESSALTLFCDLAGVDEPATDEAAMELARKRQAQLAKPPGSLGRLEDFSIQLAGITGQVHNQVEKKHLLVFAADNGVVAEGVSSSPQSVTLMQTINLTKAKTGAATLAKHFGCGITVCDVGVNANIREPAVLNRKIAYGTRNMAKEPAMTREQALQAILTGVHLALDTDAQVMGVGEMGIGNTTTSSAILAVLLGVDVEKVTGRGGGITDESFRKKKEVIRQAIALHKPKAEDVVDVLAKVGGFDVAAMCGAFLGGAASHRPMVIDGFISAVAALCACRLCPNVQGYLIPSHASFEIGYKLAMEAMDLQPMLLLGMRLGEGSGCPIAFQVLEAACAIINHMATFDQAGIDDSYLDEIRQGDKFTVEAKV